MQRRYVRAVAGAEHEGGVDHSGTTSPPRPCARGRGGPHPDQTPNPEPMKATWNGATIAESDETVVVEGNHYFPPDALVRGHVAASDHRTTCPWKGEASYYDVVVDGQTNANAAWTYPEPKEAAAEIRDHVAFWKGVEVTG